MPTRSPELGKRVYISRGYHKKQKYIQQISEKLNKFAKIGRDFWCFFEPQIPK